MSKKPPEKPTRSLPTPRLGFKRQCVVLRGWVAASGSSGKPTTNGAVARIVGIAQPTVSLANAFFVENGLLQKTEGGIVPATEVKSFARFCELSPESAGKKLAPLMKKTWFYESLEGHLGFGQMTVKEAIATLGEASNAGREYWGPLEVLLEYLELSGLIQRDGDLIRSVSQSRSAEPEAAATPDTRPKKGLASMPRATEGAVNFHVDVRVDMDELSGWPADRIAAFFSGIAQVLAAKSALDEKDET